MIHFLLLNLKCNLYNLILQILQHFDYHTILLSQYTSFIYQWSFKRNAHVTCTPRYLSIIMTKKCGIVSIFMIVLHKFSIFFRHVITYVQLLWIYMVSYFKILFKEIRWNKILISHNIFYQRSISWILVTHIQISNFY